MNKELARALLCWHSSGEIAAKTKDKKLLAIFGDCHRSLMDFYSQHNEGITEQKIAEALDLMISARKNDEIKSATDNLYKVINDSLTKLHLYAEWTTK